MKYKVASIICLLLVGLIVGPQIATAAPDKEVSVTGMAYISNDNLVKAREQAINDGLRRAVEQVVGTFISSQTKTANAQLIEDEILKSSQGYVKKYQILDKSIAENSYKIKLRATVSSEDLTNDLEVLKLNIKRHGNPRLMILVSQEDDNYYINLSSQVTETALMSKFIESGYQVIDRYQIKKVTSRDQRRTILGGNYQLAAKIGSELKADVVIIGSAQANHVDLDDVVSGDIAGDLKAYQAQFDAKAINTETAQVIATVIGEGKGAGVNREDAAQKALTEAANSAGERLIEKVSQSLINQEQTIQLKVLGVDSLQQLSRLKNKLSTITGVKNSYFREYSSNLVTFDLDLEPTTEVLNIALELQEKVNFKFEIQNMSNAKLILKVK
ncbi:hypothetical protein JCM16358_12600 [Halanaerocella petrolearia]